ncbi:MAG: hypothetical protein HKN67_00900, partial [Saprospiraceae bacterium]|nr:hypothetical protein [Saprospiraceae bacterium]
MARKFLYVLIALIILLLIGILLLGPQLRVANAYAAKKSCSCIYISKRPLSSVKEQDLSFFPLNILKLRNDSKRKKVVSSFFGLFKAKAQYKEGLGCSIIHGKDDYGIRFITERPTAKYLSDSLPWPYGKSEVKHSLTGVGFNQLEKGFNMAFDKEGEWKKKTRALLVVHKDSLVMEQYSEGFDKNTPILGWSMTKSITNALIGILVKQ